MKKTKIAFEDIKAGDLIEAVTFEYGVKMVCSGVVFERAGSGMSGIYDWQNSQGGAIVSNIDEATIYRIDVVDVKFEDIRAGDRIRVTTTRPEGRIEIVEDNVQNLVQGMNPFWVNSAPDTVIFEKVYLEDGTTRSIEILERTDKTNE